LQDTGEGLKQLMRSYPQAVTVVTTANRGEPFGVTVSAFSTISLDPPLVMVSMTKGTAAHDVISGASHFAVNILAADQAKISERFAGRSESHKFSFEGLAVEKAENGCTLIRTAVGHIECTRASSHDEGDHTVIMGKVTRVKHSHDAPPLLYYKRGYTTVASTVPTPSAADSLFGEW
jgi:flavin reductase (DIM6/NTAB) family NADH-FMN oxidoreductase RutF